MKPLIKEHRVLAAFFAAYYVGLLMYGATTGASQTIFYAVFGVGGALVVSRLYTRAPFARSSC